jgi:hypothetical protein
LEENNNINKSRKDEGKEQQTNEAEKKINENK